MREANHPERNEQGGQHLAYYTLMETAREPNCPICTLVERTEAQFYDSLLYSQVANPGFLDRYAAAGGFCERHGHHLVRCNDGLAVAMLYQPLLNQLKRPGETKRGWLPGWLRMGRSRSRRRRGPDARCPACETVVNTEQHYLAVLHQYRQDRGMEAAVTSGGGLCLPHYRMYASRHIRTPSWLRQHQERIHQQIYQSLERYIAWENYSSRDKSKISEDDLMAWQRVVDYVHGKAGTV